MGLTDMQSREREFRAIAIASKPAKNLHSGRACFPVCVCQACMLPKTDYAWLAVTRLVGKSTTGCERVGVSDRVVVLQVVQGTLRTWQDEILIPNH